MYHLEYIFLERSLAAVWVLQISTPPPKIIVGQLREVRCFKLPRKPAKNTNYHLLSLSLYKRNVLGLKREGYNIRI